MLHPGTHSTSVRTIWRLGLAAWLLVLLFAGAAGADSWAPFSNRRVVSPSGRRYVVIREQKSGGIRFALCERSAEAPPMKGVVDRWSGWGKSAGKPDLIGRDPKDKLLASGTVDHLPVAVHVLENGGFVLFETYARLGYGSTITYVNERGKVVLEKKLTEIYGAVPSGSVHSESSIWWERCHWVDRERRSVVVVSVQNEMREVALDSGKVTSPDCLALLRWCEVGPEASRARALEVMSRIITIHEPHLAGLRTEILRRFTTQAVNPAAEKIAWSPEAPLSLRLRAAILLVRSKHSKRPAAFGPLFLSATRPDVEDHVRFYAALNLPEVLGVRAVPHLQALIRSEPKTFDNEVVRGAIDACRGE